MKKLQASKDFPDAFYRVSTKGLYVRDGKVMLIKDINGRNDFDKRPEWELPGGGLDFGEDLVEGLRREIKEEMGLEVTKISKSPKYVWTVKRDMARGMEWFYVLALIFVIDLKDLNFIPCNECSEIKFFSKEELKENYDDLGAQVKPLAEAFNPAEFS